MQKEKKKILDQVTETETYKKAKEILLKFAPDQLRMTPVSFFIIITIILLIYFNKITINKHYNFFFSFHLR